MLCIIDVNSKAIRKVQDFGGLLSKEQDLSHFYVSPTGQYLIFLGEKGAIYVISASTFVCVHQLQMNDEVKQVAFDPLASDIMYSCGGSRVYCWNLQSGEPVSMFEDEGSFQCTAIAVSAKFIAVGSSSGYVNVYVKPNLGNMGAVTHPKPVHSFTNLTTEISQLQFNSDGQLLGMLSSMKPGQLRLAHFPSMKVFSNFSRAMGLTMTRHLKCFSFSSGNRYLAIGNDRGIVHLLRLKDYDS